MNEFLRNLRSQQKDKFSGSYRSPSDKSSYPHPDRRSGNDRRSQSSSRGSVNTDILAKKLTEMVPDIRLLMDAVIDTNDRMAEIMDRFVSVEEHRNSIFESIAKSIELLAENGLGLGQVSGGNGEFKKTKKIPREEKDKIMDLIFSMRENGSTYEQIAEYLESERIPTFSNKGHWHAQTIHRLYQQRKNELNM